ncbi:hypothetical protein BDW74DRAFT_156210 [Aspergillus multicolor]|uniref:uncharacterized protein n=1 Tax=Aspergillus multicolor TaxID=41759 RepID=UPI003CCDCE2E
MPFSFLWPPNPHYMSRWDKPSFCLFPMYITLSHFSLAALSVLRYPYVSLSMDHYTCFPSRRSSHNHIRVILSSNFFKVSLCFHVVLQNFYIYRYVRVMHTKLYKRRHGLITGCFPFLPHRTWSQYHTATLILKLQRRINIYAQPSVGRPI